MTENQNRDPYSIREDGPGNWTRPKTAPQPAQQICDAPPYRFNRSSMTLTLSIQAKRDLAKTIRNRAFRKGYVEKVSDLKMTAIGYPTAKMIKDALKDLSPTDRTDVIEKIHGLIRETNWDWLVKKNDGKETVYCEFSKEVPDMNHPEIDTWRHSVALMIELPGLPSFYQKLGYLLLEATGDLVSLDVPIPHITLFVKGASPDGIGINSKAEYNLYKVEEWLIS